MNKPKTPENDSHWCTGNDMCPICRDLGYISNKADAGSSMKPTENVIYRCSKNCRSFPFFLNKQPHGLSALFDDKGNLETPFTPCHGELIPYIPQSNYLELEEKLKYVVDLNQYNGACIEIANLRGDLFLAKEALEYAIGELDYNNTHIDDRILAKINNLIGKKREFQSIVVVGKSDEDFESTFNLSEVINTISIEVSVDEHSKLVDDDSIFSLLIEKIS